MITSIHNPKIQAIRTWQTRPHKRQLAQKFIVEGVRLLEEVLKANRLPEVVLYTSALDERGQKIMVEFQKLGCPLEQVSENVMQAISDTQSPQGLLAVLPMIELAAPEKPSLVLLLDAIRDPGNLGSMLRTAHAAGVEVVWLSLGCVDPFSPKVIRAAMGAHFHLPIRDMSWEQAEADIVKVGLQAFLADVANGLAYHQVDFRQPLVLIIGGEAQGASSAARQIAHAHVHIPMPANVESLNASVAAGILLFEIACQRNKL